MDELKKIIKTIVTITIVVGCIFIIINSHLAEYFFSQLGDEDTKFSEEVFVEQVRTAMLNGEETLKLSYKGNIKDGEAFMTEAIERALEIDGKDTSSDYDYLRYNYSGMNVTIKGVLNSFVIEYKFTYYETKEQTEVVDKAITDILADLHIEEKQQDKKVKAIHDFIINNASFDETIQKNSVYDNLINGSSVCQGYAALFYKMCTEAGIPCRIITGTGKGVPHAWNIVKLGAYWYNVDLTWDDPISSDGKQRLLYNYFLKSNREFGNHIRDLTYFDETFEKEHPMASTSYKIK